jgi:soluble lytic murein transglycosylase-like protein
MKKHLQSITTHAAGSSRFSRRRRFFRLGYAVVLTFAAGMARADTLPGKANYADEAPSIRALLQRAAKYEAEGGNSDRAWDAAVRYCEASRLGSTEAQYRLGMLYAFGKGVPENRALAAALFSVASHQGNYEAGKMLETINFTSFDLPACVTSETLPERAPAIHQTAEGVDIERRLASLPKTKRWIVELVDTLARWNDVDPKLVLAIIAVESNFDVKARSPKAAMGLMQLIPDTAERFNIRNAFDATQNIRGGIRYLRWLLSYYQGDIVLVASAYNSGEGTVDRYKGMPPYRETRNYVRHVMQLYGRQSHPYDKRIVAPSQIVTRTR